MDQKRTYKTTRVFFNEKTGAVSGIYGETGKSSGAEFANISFGGFAVTGMLCNRNSEGVSLLPGEAKRLVEEACLDLKDETKVAKVKTWFKNLELMGP